MDDSCHEDLIPPTPTTLEDVELTPAPKRSPRKSSRPSSIGPRRRISAAQSDENRQPALDTTMPVTPVSPGKRASPRKRNSVAPIKSGRASMATADATLLTPRPSPHPDPPQQRGTPLGDITSATVNGSSLGATQHHSVTKVKPMDTLLEKPMDIVLRTRAVGVLQMAQPEPDEPRMVIRHLVLTNFKSYAGRQEVGPFHASFSSVVGPNGSGKSNVIDSLLFVFGFRASKMRQGKLSALIHNSARIPDPGFCEVEVHFEDIRDLPNRMHEIVPDSTLCVSRKAFKNNSSKYYINGNESTFTAVTNLLKDRGVDLDHKRFLILQGEVESIAQMKPKAATQHDDGLLEYLEDIIGTSKYKVPIEESHTSFNELNEVCLEKSSRVQHVEKEKNSLEDKKSKALAFVIHENDLTTKQSTLYQVYVEECNDNLNVSEEAIAQMKIQLAQEQAKHHGNEHDIRQLEKACKAGKDECDALDKDMHATTKELAKAERDAVKFDEKEKFLAGKQRKLEKTIQSSRLATSEAASLIERHCDDIVRMAGEISSLEESMKTESLELLQIRESLTGKTQAFSEQIAAKQKQLEPWLEKINAKDSSIAVVQSELEILREQASAGKVAFQALQDKILNIRELRHDKITEIECVKQERAKLEQELIKVTSEQQKMAEGEPKMRSQMVVARQKADEARASFSKSQSQSNVLKGLMRLKESGRIDGFHGRLGSLGAIDNRYDVAITTACPQLENLVVDSVEIGQQCIDHLRKNGLGRANFILLDRLSRQDLSPPETPEGVPRLFDLVKPRDEVFKPAFFSVLQNTLVADDLEQANRIAYGARRWRVVTLDGQMIDVSGTMSGGGTRVARGGMSSRLVNDTTRDQVLKLETNRDSLERDFQSFQDELRALGLRSKEVTSKMPSFDIRIQKISLEVESADRNLIDIDKRAAELSSQQQPSQDESPEIKILDLQLAKHQRELGDLRAQTSGIEAEIKELQDKIMEVGGIKLRGQKAKVEGLKEQIDTLGEESSNAEVAKSKATKDKAKHEKVCQQTEKDLTALARELEGLGEERQTHVAATEKAKDNANAAQTSRDRKQDELEQMRRDVEEKIAELNELRAVEIEMRNKLDENQKTLSENQKRRKYWTDKLDGLALHSLK